MTLWERITLVDRRLHKKDFAVVKNTNEAKQQRKKEERDDKMRFVEPFFKHRGFIGAYSKKHGYTAPRKTI